MLILHMYSVICNFTLHKVMSLLPNNEANGSDAAF